MHMGFRLKRAAAVGLVCLAAGLTGCDILLCKSAPTESHPVCDPNQPACGGGSSDPAPDFINDAAVDIGVYSPDDIPARLILRVPNEGRLHVPDDTVLSYMTNPPASGPHFETPASTGYYCRPLNPGHWVHSLEHGYCVLLYDDSYPQAALSKSLLSLLPILFPPSPTFGNVKLVVAPYSGMVHPFCLVTWNRQFYLDDLDLVAMTDFYTQYIDMAPEAIP